MSFYAVPTTGSGTEASPFMPAFIVAAGITAWQMAQFGTSCIVWADATPAQDALIAANVGAVVVPALDNQVGAALATVQTDIEALNMPADWVTSGMTYRTILRILIGMAQLIEAIQGQGVNPTIAGHLSDTLGSFPANVRTALQTAATQLGLSTAGITGSTTLRAALFQIGQEFVAGTPITFGDL